MEGTDHSIQELLARGMERHRAGAAREALTVYEAVVRVDPGQPEAHFLKALVHLDLGEAAACLDHLGRAIDLRPGVVDYRLVRADVLNALGGRDDAVVADLEAAFAAAPDHPQVSRALAAAARRRDAWEAAAEHLARAVRLAPGDAAVKQDFVEALQGYAAAVAGNPPTATDEISWREIQRAFLRFLVLAGGDAITESAYGEFLLAWTEVLAESDLDAAQGKVEEALARAISPELRARGEETLVQLRQMKKDKMRRMRREAFKSWVSKTTGGESLESVEARIVEEVRLRRAGLAQPDPHELERRRAEEHQEPWREQEERAKYRLAFHPYLGYVQRSYVEGTSYINNHGFWMPEPWLDYPYNGEKGDDFIVAVFGGSLAHQFFWQVRTKIHDLFTALPAATGRTVTVLNFSQGGFGQPQALISYFYFRSIGQRFDVVVNIDGFNEAMGKRTNQRNGFHVSLPLSWVMNNLMLQFQAPSDDPEALDFMGRLLRTQAKVARLKAAGGGGLARWRLAKAQEELDALRARTPIVPQDRQKEPTVLPRTPPVPDEVFSNCPATATALAEEIAELWARSSILMAQGCAAAGTRYLHCLQPNPYFWNKKLSEEEDRIYIEGSPEYWAIRQTYPLMLARADELAANGVDFVDLTGCFDRVEEKLARDCCHFTSRGYDIMFEALAPRLEAATQSLRPVHPPAA
jgi:hypothetical protein